MRKEQEEQDTNTHTLREQERIRATKQLLRRIPKREFLSRERIAHSRHRIKGLSLLIVLLDACTYVYAVCYDA